MNNDLISRQSLKNDIERAFDAADLTDYEPSAAICEIYDKCIDEEPTAAVTFTREELEAWLYANAINNLDGQARNKIFADDCKIIIDRLDGFERFVKDRREGKI